MPIKINPRTVVLAAKIRTLMPAFNFLVGAVGVVDAAVGTTVGAVAVGTVDGSV